MLAGWSSWGAIPQVFDESKEGWKAEREELRGLLTADQWRQAERTTINAHYTDPAVVAQMWRLMEALGFAGGRVLEPGAGSGTFIGMAPESAEMVGVEWDEVTASIVSAMYPHAEVRAESFADTRLPGGFFDAVIGNVPFANVALHDPVHNAGRHSMHNHFIVKSLALTRPGGLVVVLTSHYTMDAQNPAARREIARMAGLLGAVRLPSGSHRRTAGTEAVEDLLVLRRRDGDGPSEPEGWELVTPVEVEGGATVKVNTYFAERPDHVLGTFGVGRGMHGPETMMVHGDLDGLAQHVERALSDIAASAQDRGLGMTARPPGEDSAAPAVPVPAPPDSWDGTIVPGENGTFQVVAAGGLKPLKVPKNARAELRALLGLRDAATALLSLEAATVEDTDEVAAARTGLRQRYEDYTRRYGPLNRFTLRRTGRQNDAGEDTFARIVPTPLRVLRGDPFGALVLALEHFDEQDQTATPAEIMSRRVVGSKPEVMGAETPADAVAVSLDRTGGIDLDLIARLLGMPPDEATAALDDLVFTDPDSGGSVYAPEYLSGDVRSKLDAAESRAESDPAFERNVEALRGVLPAELGVEDITAQLGAVWISAEVHRQFLAELLDDPDVEVENPLPGMWEVSGRRWGIRSISEWGTRRRPAPAIAEAVMEQRVVQVYDTTDDGDGSKRQVLNPVETTAAQEKADALQERFADWVWEDPERALGLVAEYNRRFNSLALRDYSGAGDHLSLPGLTASFTPRPHQRAAVARMIAEPSAGLFHEVGAGKTAEMIMGAMEMRRIGLVTKPVVVVPNHMLEQFTRDWLQLYPRARVLAAGSKDLTADRRRLFVARAAANDWDAVLLTQGAFAKIPIGKDTEIAYINQQIDQVDDVLMAAGGGMSVKQIQKRKLSLENKLRRVDTERDPGVTFEATGIDYVIVDEMHGYKNLATPSNIREAAITGSDRAADLHMKLEYLRSTGRERIVTGATATPISNSVTEAYVMQRYMRPDLLDAAGIGAFDAWAATFGNTVTQMEMSPTGTSFRQKTRFAKFQNVPEMLRMWSVFADVKTKDDLQLPQPELVERADGQRVPETVIVQPTAELEAFIADLGDRADAVAAKEVQPTEDNMLKISTDGRKAALDIRMVVPDQPSGPTKVDTAADAICRVWEATRDNTYLDPLSGEPSPVPGALQLVFSDIGTPNPERWNAYDELRLLLIERGMPAESIRFIHEAGTDADKARLFAAARSGHVSVLMGSTEKMGVGTNVQARAVALYHMDCPWRPSDIAQRDGRILRQGNQHDEVAIVRLVTEGSFDSYMWQGVERKARFISQLMRGRLDTREVDEIDDAALSAAEAKALSSGNPLLLELSTAQADTSRLQRLQRAHTNNQAMLAASHRNAAAAAEGARGEIAALQQVVGRVTDTSGDRFRIRLFDTTYTNRAEAATALTTWARRNAMPGSRRGPTVVGQISSFDIEIDPRYGHSLIEIQLTGVPGSRTTISRDILATSGIGLVQRIENRASGIPTYLANAEHRLAIAEQTLRDTEERIGTPFKHAQALHDAAARLADITQQLAELEAPEPEPQPGDPEHSKNLNGDTPPRRQPAPLATFGQRVPDQVGQPVVSR